MNQLIMTAGIDVAVCETDIFQSLHRIKFGERK